MFKYGIFLKYIFEIRFNVLDRVRFIVHMTEFYCSSLHCIDNIILSNMWLVYNCTTNRETETFKSKERLERLLPLVSGESKAAACHPRDCLIFWSHNKSETNSKLTLSVQFVGQHQLETCHGSNLVQKRDNVVTNSTVPE